LQVVRPDVQGALQILIIGAYSLRSTKKSNPG